MEFSLHSPRHALIFESQIADQSSVFFPKVFVADYGLLCFVIDS